MKILVIGQPDSLHTLSFVRFLKSSIANLDITFFPSSPMPVSKDLAAFVDLPYRNPYEAKVPADYYWNSQFSVAPSPFSGNVGDLVSLMSERKFDRIHVNCIQDAGLLLLNAFETGFQKQSKCVSLSIWGNDIYLFQHFPVHNEKIKRLLSFVDIIFPESSREISLASENGFAGLFTPLVQATLLTNSDLAYYRNLLVQKAKRKLITIRSDPASPRTFSTIFLYFLTRYPDLVQEYEICIVGLSPMDTILASELKMIFGNRLTILPSLARNQFLELIAETQIFVSLTRSDGVPNSFLECLALRAYPFFSDQAGLRDWSSRAFFTQVSPYNVDEIRYAIEKIFKVPECTFRRRIEENISALDFYSPEYVSKCVRLGFEVTC